MKARVESSGECGHLIERITLAPLRDHERSRHFRDVRDLLLRWMGDQRHDTKLVRAANEIEAAVDRVIAKPDGRTRDMGGKTGTDAFGKKVAEAVS